jgi:uncharacterized protein DUF4365
LSITLQHTEESLCVSHIYALAGMAGLNYAIKYVLDYGVDGQFSFVKIRDGRRVNSGFPLDFQAKATVNWEQRNGRIVYDLEAKTYNDIVSRTAAETTLVLILLCLPKDPTDWHIVLDRATVLQHSCYWYSFTGEATNNTARKRIFVPVENRLTPSTLNDLLEKEKARRLTQTL